MMAKAGDEIDASINVPFAMSKVEKGVCDTSLPMEISVSSLVDTDTLRAMFAK